MPAVVEFHPAHVPPEYRRKYTREDCRVLAAAGLLDLERYELIDGELVSKMGKSRLHSNVLCLLAKWLVAVFGDDFVDKKVSVRLDPVNEPEPDAIVLNKPALSIQTDNPTPAGIIEYWVLDIDKNRIVVHRDPAPTGYQSIAAYSAREALSPLAAPHAILHLTSLLP